jgi:hypothetical protein
MATQKCPKCGSKNIRHGYRPTHILFKIAFCYNLLCNDCNLEFKGFAIPGTVSRKGKKARKVDGTPKMKPPYESFSPNFQLDPIRAAPVPVQIVSEITEKAQKGPRNVVKKRVKVKLNRA